MDEIDKKIVLLLQEEARISMTELGKSVSLSQPAVTERVRRMEEKGIIDSYRAVVSPEKINKQITAYVLIHTKGCESFVEHCKQADEVVELHRISGQYNFLVKVVTENLQTLEMATNQMGVYGDSTTLIVLSSPIKNDKLVPIILNKN
ncbi:Lrp/AsnC family transcriptional regulator [Fictibacillus sp. WQ 8-8]|uniref:Lrp/AsnC family transcriptional regulator n=1 Tax=Fictibacillus sp. WQ 8-8 TaxID=2938788 RepID=UPI00210D311A|nr:Lrp/AsnC family transcriptional regulator [Fictibacillus sp. WQ 8-8]MCQ6268735.1 Lrp/AsnC family transcriptional regulator [Fictibacillus sp. WQ 8-8]